MRRASSSNGRQIPAQASKQCCRTADPNHNVPVSGICLTGQSPLLTISGIKTWPRKDSEHISVFFSAKLETKPENIKRLDFLVSLHPVK